MSRTLLLRIAATLSILTCIAHTIGTFMEVPAEQVAMHETIATMKRTMIPMPVGAPRSYMEILDGNNLCTSLLLMLCGTLLLAIAPSPKDATSDRVILIVALALIGLATLSSLYFFPVPAIFTGLSALLCFISRAQPHAKKHRSS